MFPLLSLLSILFPNSSSFFLGVSIGFPTPDNLFGDTGNSRVEVRLLQLTLPDNDDAPAFSFQLSPDLLIPLLVPGYLSHPELCVGLGYSIIPTVFVAMPKASVHEDYRPILWQHDIRPARKGFVVYPVTKSLVPKCETQRQLRLGRSGVNCGHIAMALNRSVFIRHCRLQNSFLGICKIIIKFVKITY